MQILQLVFTICMGLVNYSTCEIITMNVTPTPTLASFLPRDSVTHSASSSAWLPLSATCRTIPHPNVFHKLFTESMSKLMFALTLKRCEIKQSLK